MGFLWISPHSKLWGITINEEDKGEIRQEAIDYFRNKMKVKYSDVKYPEEELDKLVDETIKETLA